MQREPLATSFPCLFCNHENSVTVKLDKKGGIGDLSCKVCGQSFQSGINCELHLDMLLQHCPQIILRTIVATDRQVDLSAPVDVYSDWVDACDSVDKERGEPGEGMDSHGDMGDGVGGDRGSYNHHALAAGNDNAADYDDEI